MAEYEAQNHETDSVGAILRDLRNRENLGVQEVASRLHLEPRVIELLENDAYDNLPASIYVRGYIRNYSKLVGADAEHLIRLYDQAGVEEEPEIIPEVRHSAQTSSSDKPVKVVTYLISLILVILLIAWWQSNFLIKDLGVPAGKAAGNERTAEAPAFDYHFDVVPGSTNPFYRAKQEDVSGTAAGTEEGAPEIKPAESAAEPPAAAAPPPPREPRTITSETTGPDTIRMQLSADSWIEVTDAYDQRVFFSLGRAGDTLILHGTAPFSVLLGFARGVKMEFNGKPFDLASHSRSGVAHFTLGEPSAEGPPQTPAAEEPSPAAEEPSPATEEPSPGTEEP